MQLEFHPRSKAFIVYPKYFNPTLALFSLTTSTKEQSLKILESRSAFHVLLNPSHSFCKDASVLHLLTHFFAANSGNVCFLVTVFSQECQQASKIEGMLLS